jgi:hypothetical protein
VCTYTGEKIYRKLPIESFSSILLSAGVSLVINFIASILACDAFMKGATLLDLGCTKPQHHIATSHYTGTATTIHLKEEAVNWWRGEWKTAACC